MSEKQYPETDVDAYLEKVYHMNDGPNKVSSFLNNIFGYLYKKHPEELYGNSNIDGQHIVSQSFCKWRHKYMNEKSQKSSKIQCSVDNNIPPNQDLSDHIPPIAVSEVEVETSQELFASSFVNAKDLEKTKNQSSSRSDKYRQTVLRALPHLQTLDNVTVEPEDVQKAMVCGLPLPISDTPVSQRDADKKSVAYFDSSNGADLGSYAWTQTVDDIEVRVPVPKTVERGKQVKVVIKSSSLEVRITETGSEWVTHIAGNLLNSIKVEESIWSLSPKQHILINLEKCEERWWNKLLEKEKAIDLNNINAERDYGTLPEEDRSKIQELVWNKHQKDQGKPTSDALKMQSVLRDAWNAEGSPFKGQPYDPSLVNFAPGGKGFPS